MPNKCAKNLNMQLNVRNHQNHTSMHDMLEIKDEEYCNDVDDKTDGDYYGVERSVTSGNTQK